MLQHFKAIAGLVGQVGPKLDAAERMGPDHVYIETRPLIDRGVPIARVWGPFENEDAAHNYINVKRDRHRIANAAHFGKGGTGTIENDKHIYGHPDFAYRIMPGTAYYSKFVAQIVMEGLSALVNEFNITTEFEPPSDHYGILDNDDMENEDESD